MSQALRPAPALVRAANFDALFRWVIAEPGSPSSDLVASMKGALGVDRHDPVPLLGRYLDGWSQSLAHGFGVGQDIKTTVLLAREGDEGAGQQLGGALAWVLEHLPENPAVDQLAAIAMMAAAPSTGNSSPRRVPRRTAG